MFSNNEGTLERLVRLVFGVSLFLWGYWISGSYWLSYQKSVYPVSCWDWENFVSHACIVERGFAIAVIGSIPLLTGIIGWCPLKSILRLEG